MEVQYLQEAIERINAIKTIEETLEDKKNNEITNLIPQLQSYIPNEWEDEDIEEEDVEENVSGSIKGIEKKTRKAKKKLIIDDDELTRIITNVNEVKNLTKGEISIYYDFFNEFNEAKKKWNEKNGDYCSKLSVFDKKYRKDCIIFDLSYKEDFIVDEKTGLEILDSPPELKKEIIDYTNSVILNALSKGKFPIAPQVIINQKNQEFSEIVIPRSINGRKYDKGLNYFILNSYLKIRNLTSCYFATEKQAKSVGWKFKNSINPNNEVIWLTLSYPDKRYKKDDKEYVWAYKYKKFKTYHFETCFEFNPKNNLSTYKVITPEIFNNMRRMTETTSQDTKRNKYNELYHVLTHIKNGPKMLDDAFVKKIKNASGLWSSNYILSAKRKKLGSIHYKDVSNVSDGISLYELGRYKSVSSYLAIFAHEIGHSTETKERTNRVARKLGHYEEELVADLVSCRLCILYGIYLPEKAPDNMAGGYYKNFEKLIKKSKTAFWTANNLANEAVDYILNNQEIV